MSEDEPEPTPSRKELRLFYNRYLEDPDLPEPGVTFEWFVNRVIGHPSKLDDDGIPEWWHFALRTPQGNLHASSRSLLDQKCYDKWKELQIGHRSGKFDLFDGWQGTADRFEADPPGYSRFYEWSLGSGFGPDAHALVRLNKKGGFDPQNCRWLSKEAYQAQRSKPKRIGESVMSVKEASELSGIPVGTLYQRMNKLGRTLEQAVAMGPSQRARKSVEEPSSD